MVTIMRIDDRLVHGQIVTMWLSEADAKLIVVADDLAAGDAMQQMILKMGVPAGVTLKVLSLADAYAVVESPQGRAENILLLVRSPQSAKAFLELGFQIDAINLGNISNRATRGGEKRVRVQLNLWPLPEDVRTLREIAAMGVRLESRAVPSDKSQDVIPLLAKHFQ